MLSDTPLEVKPIEFKPLGYVQSEYGEAVQENEGKDNYGPIRMLDSPLSEEAAEDFLKDVEFVPIVVTLDVIVQGHYVSITMRNYGNVVTWLALIQDDMYETSKVGCSKTMERAKSASKGWVVYYLKHPSYF